MTRLLRPAILIALAKKPLYGYAILQQLAQMPLYEHNAPDTSGVYRALKEMESEGVLKSSWDTETGSTARRMFAITESGLKCLSNWRLTLGLFQNNVTALITVMDQTLAELSKPAD